jgi:hypothetical protein
MQSGSPAASMVATISSIRPGTRPFERVGLGDTGRVQNLILSNARDDCGVLRAEDAGDVLQNPSGLTQFGTPKGEGD